MIKDFGDILSSGLSSHAMLPCVPLLVILVLLKIGDIVFDPMLEVINWITGLGSSSRCRTRVR